MRFFFLLFFIPQFLFASFSHDDCHNVLRKIEAEWVKRNQLIQQFINLKDYEKEKGIPLLQEAIACCQKAIGYCDKILSKIAKKSKSERHETWWVEIKKGREQQKLSFQAEIASLQEAIQKLQANAAIEQMRHHYQESERIALLAQTKIEACPPLSFDTAKEILLSLQEVIQLYEQAQQQVELALMALLRNPFAIQEEKEILQEQIKQFASIIVVYRNAFTELSDEYNKAISSQG